MAFLRPSTWPDWFRRGIRTWAQSFTGTFLMLLAAQQLAPGEVPSLAVLQKIGVAALFASAGAIMTMIHNWAEDTRWVPVRAVLKAPTNPGVAPLPDPVRRVEHSE